MTDTDGAQCTANFVYYDASDVYIGQAAHCSGTGAATSTDGCTSASLLEGTAVVVDGARRAGTTVYNSWVRMQADGEKDPDTCAYNDLALVKLDPADASKVNPSVPSWGGPKGIDADGTRLKDQVERTATASATTATAGATPSTPRPPASPATRARPCSTTRARPSAC